jgi:hypothetical protein
MGVPTTIERDDNGTIRAFVNGYEYASTNLPATASAAQRRRVEQALRQQARRAYLKEKERYGGTAW